jgi:hypothetical protein
MEANANLAINSVPTQAESRHTDFLDNRHLQHLAISESGFVFDPGTGQSFNVNETGVELLRLFQQESNIDAIVDKQQKKYNANSLEIQRDILEFASRLNRYFYI